VGAIDVRSSDDGPSEHVETRLDVARCRTVVSALRIDAVDQLRSTRSAGPARW